MEEDNEYKNGFPKIDSNKESVLKMLSKVAAFKMEERDLALDRFKRCNEDMEDEAFFLQGKTAIMYLDSASRASNYLGDIAKDMMKFAFEVPSGEERGGVEDKSALSQLASSMIKEKRLKDNQKRIGPDTENYE
jgi:hypothetical protein